jgi:hypothetical protein
MINASNIDIVHCKQLYVNSCTLKKVCKNGLQIGKMSSLATSYPLLIHSSLSFLAPPRGGGGP